MYIPMVREEVAVESNERVWRVMAVDYLKKTADLRTVSEPVREWREVPFGLLLALCDAYPGEN